MTTTPLQGLDSSDRIMIPRNAARLVSELQDVANQRQKDTLVFNIEKSIMYIQHKLNVARYQAVLTRKLNTRDFTSFKLHPGRVPSSDIAFNIFTYSMLNMDEYVLVLTFLIETFAATVFSLFDISGNLINYLYNLELLEKDM